MNDDGSSNIPEERRAFGSDGNSSGGDMSNNNAAMALVSSPPPTALPRTDQRPLAGTTAVPAAMIQPQPNNVHDSGTTVRIRNSSRRTGYADANANASHDDPNFPAARNYNSNNINIHDTNWTMPDFGEPLSPSLMVPDYGATIGTAKSTEGEQVVPTPTPPPATTPPSTSQQLPKPNHDRGVSWDLNIQEFGEPRFSPPSVTTAATGEQVGTPPALQSTSGHQPNPPPRKGSGLLPPRPPTVSSRMGSVESGYHSIGGGNYSDISAGESFFAYSPGASEMTDSCAGGSRGVSTRKNPTTNMELEASIILNEVQAERMLMLKLDQTDPLRPRAGTGQSILSEVPIDELQHNFFIEDVDGLVLQPSNSSKSTRGTMIQQQHDGLSSTSRSRQIKEPSFRSTASRKTSGDRSGGRHDEQKSTSSPTNSKKKASKEDKKHNRNLTVEQSLFGLTKVLNEMDEEDRLYRLASSSSPSNDGSSHGRERTNTATSNDMLANADLLFERIAKRAVGASKPPAAPHANQATSNQDDPTCSTRPTITKGPTAGSRWGLLKRSLVDSKKKTDDDAGNAQLEVPHLDDSTTRQSVKDQMEIGDIEEGVKEDSCKSHDSVSTDRGSTDGSPPEQVPEIGGHSSDDEYDKHHNRSSWFTRRQKINPFQNFPFPQKIAAEWDAFQSFLAPRKQTVFTYAKVVLLYIMLPSLAIATVLFYWIENPPNGRCPTTGCDKGASTSWWILFIGCRQVVIVSAAKLTEAIVIDFLALRTALTVSLVGPMMTLLIVQSKGWPFLGFFWGLYNFALIVGGGDFDNHWLFWQDFIALMNRSNPAGAVTSSLAMYRICAIAMGVGAAVAVKRLAIGIYLGRKTFVNFSLKLDTVMNQMYLLRQLAKLGRRLETRSWAINPKRLSDERLHDLMDTAPMEGARPSTVERGEINDMKNVIDPDDKDPFSGGLGSLQRQRINDLLGEWEDPQRQKRQENENATVGAVLNFRRALSCMDTDQPFGGAFGNCDTRECCIARSQKLYDRLMCQGSTVDGCLPFHVIADIALDRDGELNPDKAKALIRIFRPERNGAVSLVDFVKSVDNVYKELRMLRATVAGSMKIDTALESIFNVIFYVILACVILATMNINPLTLFLSLTSVVLAFAFMIGSASSKYFEGLLLIVVQRPYGIGDRISISNSEIPSDAGGAQGWIVEDVTLFTTTLALAATSERATIANGVIAKSRIINMARSPNAVVYVKMRFGTETPYTKIQIFRSSVEKFVQVRPKEWGRLLGFRVSKIESDLAYIEYSICLQHREGWQNIVPILNSRNTMHSYCLELSKKLDMRYKSPHLPVDLNILRGLGDASQLDLKFASEDEVGRKSNEALLLSPGSGSVDDESLAKVAAMFD